MMKTVLNSQFLNAVDYLRSQGRYTIPCRLLIEGSIQDALLGPRVDHAHCKVQFKALVDGKLVDVVKAVPFGQVILPDETRQRLEAAEIARQAMMAAQVAARRSSSVRRTVGGQFARGEARR